VDAFRVQHPDVVGYTYFSYRFGMRAKGKGWRLDYYLVGLLCSGFNSFVKPYKSHEVASACAATARAGASTSTWRTCCAPGFGVGVAGSGQVNGGRVHERVRACAAAGGTMQSRAGQRGSTLWFLKLQGLVGTVGTVAVLPLSAGCAASVSGLCC